MIEKGYFLIPFLPLGFILIGFGIFVIVRDFIFLHKIGMVYINWTGFLLIAIGISIFLFKGGFKYDIQEKTITKFLEFSGIKLWTKRINLPKSIDNVQIIKKKKTMTSYYKAVIPVSSKIITYDLYVVYNNGHKFNRLFTVDQKQAFEYGQIIADSYNVEVIKKI
ncbi:MAG: hypothetical protein U0T82_04170 [Bacteroidales bacterium]